LFAEGQPTILPWRPWSACRLQP